MGETSFFCHPVDIHLATRSIHGETNRVWSGREGMRNAQAGRAWRCRCGRWTRWGDSGCAATAAASCPACRASTTWCAAPGARPARPSRRAQGACWAPRCNCATPGPCCKVRSTFSASVLRSFEIWVLMHLKRMQLWKEYCKAQSYPYWHAAHGAALLWSVRDATSPIWSPRWHASRGALVL